MEDDLAPYLWYHGNIARDEAVRRLEPKPPDKCYFLLRMKQTPNVNDPGIPYVLTVKPEDGIYRHYPIFFVNTRTTTFPKSGFYITDDVVGYDFLGTIEEWSTKLQQGELKLEISKVGDQIVRIPIQCRPLNRLESRLPLIEDKSFQPNASIMSEPTPVPAPRPNKMRTVSQPFPSQNRNQRIISHPQLLEPFAGYLLMQKITRILPSQPKRWYFKVDNKLFSKFIAPSSDDCNPESAYRLADVLSIEKCESENKFVLKIANKTSLRFQADSKLERDDWVSELKIRHKNVR